ncbi:tRNA (adenine-N(6)-)-methyltransferase [Myroides marinus]|uniref:tRNA1(Val) (adenine(37)-N6)-methyltransferase n=1 Tax=Myroides marinus TaxID=703342 RepID=A0A165RJR9_9FLAO|nr:methyltransferase [Myroides marinus]KUF44383.1 tRNA (adenine-N(6)-)-methyltransferase [Myroides marinus]KZE82782.1 tRNA (adenine-N(6)-)-methyltransferase [Myroides marinus]
MFQFKQFTIQQDKCAMKVGTDGVLLGAWTPVDNNPYSVLDIGSGTGLLALMMAQRTGAEQIDGVEIDEHAHEQAVENFESSPWGDRLFCYHADLETFANEMEEEYDLIISNPPFYSEDYHTNDTQRDTARFQDAMPFDLLIEAVEYFLSEKGVFSVIIPAKEEDTMIRLAAEFGIYPFKVTRVRGNEQAEIKRSLIAFSRQLVEQIPLDELIIEVERHQYTPEFQALVKDFYLKL